VTDEEIRAQVVRYSRRAYRRMLVGGTGGNVSARLSGGKMVVTATGVSLGDTSITNLVTVDLRTREWTALASFRPSKEFHYHADILEARPDVGAVMHVHPPFATAFSVRKRDIPMVTDAGFKQPPMPRVAFAPSGSEALRDHVMAAIRNAPDCRALLLEEHGIVSLGPDVTSAYNYADLVEELARIAYWAQQ
jgi:L-fuculose-phosphate aldolase